MPPRGSMFVGAGDFKKTGVEFLGYLEELAHLSPDDRILDVGCGIGRMAIPLTSYLSSEGTYEGFDLMPQGIRWCRRHITQRFPNFRFRLIEARNDFYRSLARVPSTDVRFPYPDEHFDVVLLASVFTHLLDDEVDHYLAEISRVLKPGGRCLATYFIMNAQVEALVQQGRAEVKLACRQGAYVTVDARSPRAAVGFAEDWIRQAHSRHRVPLEEPIHWGSWPGRSRFLSSQDVVIGRKEQAAAPGE